MKRKYSIKSSKFREIALERINILFEQAESAFKEDPKLSNRYVYLARKIAMKYKVRIPAKLRRKFCKNCFCYLKLSVNCRVRLRNKKIVYYCLNCKKYMRIPYSKERKK